MEYKILKRVTKNYDEKFSKERQTNEIHLSVGGVKVFITEQQMGCALNKPHIMIWVPNGYSYCMDFDTFIKNAIRL